MAFEDRSYSGNAVPATLTANINNTVTSIPISTATGWSDGTSGPFHVGIALASAPDTYIEVVRCSGRTGLTLNVQTVPTSGRGWDGTVAQSHLVGAVIVPVFTATDADEANQHYSNVALDHHTQYLNVTRHDVSARHGIGILPVGGTTSTSVVGDTSQPGTSGLLSRSDHKHAREVFGSPASAGVANVDGTAVSVPRSDHIHAGGIPILGTRPASPATHETFINSTTRRLETWNGSRWIRDAPLSPLGRTGAYVTRVALGGLPSGGATSYLIPWGAEVTDTDGYIAPDGLTTTAVTCPSVETGGLYMASLFVVWDTYFAGRSYIEIIHTFGGSTNQHRMPTENEDRGTISTLLEFNSGDTVQGGLWQDSGAVRGIAGASLQLYRISP